MVSSETVSVNLKPTAGFCIKTKTVQDALYKPVGNDSELPLGKGMKIFMNVAWDSNVPAPPETSEEIIEKVLAGTEDQEDAWYVPIVVSEGRLDADKAGNKALVFDCIANPSLKSRVLRNPEFKVFLIEIALQRIETQTPLVLSRQIGTPNISAKGKLAQRTVTIPSFLATAPAPRAIAEAPTPVVTKPLIEEISTNQSKKGILKPSTTTPSAALGWKWEKQTDGRIKIVVSLPEIPRDITSQATLDIEPRRFILHVPVQPTALDLDVDLSLSDAELSARPYKDITLTLKRQRPFDVDSANAEWRVAENRLDITL